MEPRIGFCVTEDGVRIAYVTKGEGFPVVYIPGWASHAELDLELFPADPAPFQIVRYDKRGTGLSIGTWATIRSRTDCATSRRSSARLGFAASRWSASRKAARWESHTPQHTRSGSRAWS